MFSYAAYKPEEQEELLQQLHRKVADVFRNSVEGAGKSEGGSEGGASAGGTAAGQSTLTMLTSIEQRLEELCELLESLPGDKVAEAERAKVLPLLFTSLHSQQWKEPTLPRKIRGEINSRAGR